MRILVTGTAGFIGFHLARRLIGDGHDVAGFDGFTPYYDVRLKRARHELLKQSSNFRECEGLLEDVGALNALGESFKPEVIVHLAAQAGVRYSLEHPRAYVESNLVGTFNVMELARAHSVAHFVFASTSSVYGANTDMPFAETDKTAHPLTLYAATKKATEVMSHSYSHLWDIPTTALRFFTVYGPWGRPDMALFKFVEATLRGLPIDVFNNGEMTRDFTYIDDLVEAIARLIHVAPRSAEPVQEVEDSLSPVAPWRVVNIGGGTPVNLLAYIEAMEAALGLKSIRNLMPMQIGDVPATYADSRLLKVLTSFTPSTPVAVGVKRFCDWYQSYYGPAGPARVADN